jgi:hypothetical protein
MMAQSRVVVDITVERIAGQHVQTINELRKTWGAAKLNKTLKHYSPVNVDAASCGG